MDRLSVVQIIVDSGLLILIWLVQLIIYPSLCYTADKEFICWHKRYSGLISLIIIPLMFLQAGVEVMHFLRGDVRWHRVFLISVIWVSTFSLSAPCHGRLHCDGKNLITINRLVRTNWVRTVLWSLLFLETVLVAFNRYIQ